MADWLDDLINISKEVEGLKNDFTDLAKDDSQKNYWNPVEYKERPLVDASVCVVCINEEKATCSRCIDICPTDSIIIEDGGIEIKDNCRKCGLCVSVCPTNALKNVKNEQQKLANNIATTAQMYEQCYVTCTRGLGKKPHEAQIVTPCIGVVTPQMWMLGLVDYDNISVYLPLGKCDRCKTTTGEAAYLKNIELAEQWSDEFVGYECNEEDLVLEIRREVERKDFLKNTAKKAGITAAKVNPMTRRLTKTYERFQEHSKKLNEISNTLEKVTGVSSTARKKRKLTADRALLLMALRDHDELAENVSIQLPKIDAEKCTLCGDCVKDCPTAALDEMSDYIKLVAPYCVGCNLCRDVCPEQAITMITEDARVFYDIKTEDGIAFIDVDLGDGKASKAEVEAAKANLRKSAQDTKEALGKAGDVLEKLDEE